MTDARFVPFCIASLMAAALTACAATPEAPPPPPPSVGGYTPTGNPVMDAALMAAAQAAAQSASSPPPPPPPQYVAPAVASPAAVDPATGMSPPYGSQAVPVTYAPASDPASAGGLPVGTMGIFNGKFLVPAVQTGDVKIECFYSNFPPDRAFIPMEVKVTPLARLDELTVKVDPEDGVVMRDGPQTKSIATPSDPYFRRIFAMRATDRDSFLRVSTVTKTSGSESRRTVLCPLARIDKVPDTGG